MGTVAFKRHSVHGDDRDIPASQLVLRIEQVLGESAPLAELTYQHRVNFSSLRQSHDLIARVGLVLVPELVSLWMSSTSYSARAANSVRSIICRSQD